MMKSLVSTVVALGLAGAVSAQTFTFGLDPLQEVPPVPSFGSGTCTVTLDATTGAVSVSGTYTGLTGTATMAHIHGPSPIGVSAGIVLGLGVTGGTSGTVFGGGTLTAPQVTDMLNGLHYVNVHSSTFGGGEIRGQVVQAAIVLAYGGNPAGSLVVSGGVPKVGAAMTFGVDNPTGSQPVGSLPFVGISNAADALFVATGTGVPIPGWGMAGPTGELLIAVGGPNPLLSLAGAAWAGPGSPAPVPLSIPPLVALIGFDVFAQGVMVNAIGAGPTFGLTNGLQLTIGS
jgi:hypothetical protein